MTSDFFAKVFDIFETAIDGGKANIRDFIEFFSCSMTGLPIILLGTSTLPSGT